MRLSSRTKLMMHSVIFELANVEDELTDLTFDLDVPPAVAGNEPKGLVCVLGFLWMSARE